MVDEDALFDAALTSDRIRGARLDVMVDEPPAAEYKLFTLQDVILTPHLAGPSWENWKKAFRMRVQYYDVARLSADAEDALGVRFALFPELLRSSDIVTLHVPLDTSTHKLVGARELAMMKPAAILINTCRGPVVDEDALYDALIADRIRGAGLDVMVEEPPAPEHKLFTLPNIVLTPHWAGPSWENWKKAFRNSFDNIERVARAEKPLWIIPELRG